ncbi:hypothetical protein JYU34_003404 [Plutella xylostella]|uniref:Uncharacterized protein n=1 Tax=Plutella xylostella TaxID=51655 RepID=A0ABQ7QZY8_PLUXY|nr:hypothetical protein JYU34_003404 [Plutella xylostella]
MEMFICEDKDSGKQCACTDTDTSSTKTNLEWSCCTARSVGSGALRTAKPRRSVAGQSLRAPRPALTPRAPPGSIPASAADRSGHTLSSVVCAVFFCDSRTRILC